MSRTFIDCPPLARAVAASLAASLLLLLSTAGDVLAQASQQPYAGQQTREIKALSADDVEGYLAGKGMGFAKSAELNHYPGPLHLLELGEELGLTPAQLREIEAIRGAMKAEAMVLGAEIVEQESRLDGLFADRRADDDGVEELTGIIAGLRGRLRAVHLKAHLRTTPLLSETQIAGYDSLRGYGSMDHTAHGAHQSSP